MLRKPFGQGRDSRHRLCVRQSVAVDHVSVKLCVALSIVNIRSKGVNGTQRLGQRVIAIRGKLIAKDFGIVGHNHARKVSNLGHLVVRPDDMQVIDVARERGSRGASASAISAAVRRVNATNFSAAVCVIETHAMFATSGGRLKASATNDDTGSWTAGRRNGQTATSI